MGFTVAEIAAALGAAAEGETALAVARAATPEEAGPHDLALALSPKYARELAGCKAAAALLWPGADWRGLGFRAAIFAGRERAALAGVTALFDPERPLGPGRHASACIDPSAEIGEGAAIGPFVSVGPGVRIGRRARLFAHASVAEDAVIGDDLTLGEGARIGPRVRAGDRLLVQPNAVIGADGFSWATAEPGSIDAARAGAVAVRPAGQSAGQRHLRIRSLASVRIGDDVEVGGASCIDRGTLADTVIGTGTKIDNLVQIGHNVRVGEGCLLCGQVGLAGSVEIGDRAVLGGKVGVADHLRIGAGAVIAGGSMVAAHVPAGAVMLGVPALPRDKATALLMLNRRLPDLFARLEALENRVSKSDPAG